MGKFFRYIRSGATSGSAGWRCVSALRTHELRGTQGPAGSLSATRTVKPDNVCSDWAARQRSAPSGCERSHLQSPAEGRKKSNKQDRRRIRCCFGVKILQFLSGYLEHSVCQEFSILLQHITQSWYVFTVTQKLCLTGKWQKWTVSVYRNRYINWCDLFISVITYKKVAGSFYCRRLWKLDGQNP